MTTTPFTETDYLSEARGRVGQQFKDKPVFDTYLKLAIDQITELQSVYKDLMQLRSIDTASGEQLDAIGRLFGQERTLVNYNTFPFFGFNGSSGAETFGTLSNSTLGGLFRSKDQEEGSSSTVDDKTYRFIIKARIIANSSKATPEAIISGLNFVTGNANCRVVEHPDAHITLEVENNLTDFQSYFLRGLSNQGSIIPIPVGVAVEYVFFEEDYFGMAEDSEASTLGSLGTGYGMEYGMGYGAATSSETGGYIPALA